MIKTWISNPALKQMSEEANKSYPLETGGVLAGYVADNNEHVIHYVIGPGPNALHRRRRFSPNHKWQCQQLDSLFEESAGRLVYLGDWHTHPDSIGRMSWLDERTLRGIATHPNTRLPNPLMVIGGGTPEKWRWLCHRYERERALGLLALTVETNLHIFR